MEAGAPVGAYTNLLISHDQVNRVIDDPRIKGVALTGSVEAGKSVAGRAGHNLKKSTMELGGSDAFIVLEDADLDQTVKWAVWGKMNNTGQCCVAAKRFIVVEELGHRGLRQGVSGANPGHCEYPTAASRAANGTWAWSGSGRGGRLLHVGASPASWVGAVPAAPAGQGCGPPPAIP